MGKVVLTIGDNVSTDAIYPGRFMATVQPSETPQFTFADDTDFNQKLREGKVPPGSFIVAGKNFGCGSSREQAASCLKGHNLIIVAKHFSRIFQQNSVNVGLQTIICPDLEAAEGDELHVDKLTILNATSGKFYSLVQLPVARQSIIDSGGLVPYTRAILLKRGTTAL